MKYVTVATVVAAIIGLSIGAAYASKVKAVPVVGTLLTKLPGADR